MWIIPGLFCCVVSCENAYIKQISRREKAGPWATLCSSHWTREPPLTLCISTLQSDHVLRIALLCTQPLTHIHSHACNYMHPPANLFPRTLNAAPPHLGSSFYRRYQPTYLQPSSILSLCAMLEKRWTKVFLSTLQTYLPTALLYSLLCNARRTLNQSLSPFCLSPCSNKRMQCTHYIYLSHTRVGPSPKGLNDERVNLVSSLDLYAAWWSWSLWWRWSITQQWKRRLYSLA